MRKLLFASLYALVVAGFGFAIAASITKSVQLSQDPSGPVAVDTQNSVYFPAHINNTGSVPSPIGCGGTTTIIGTDMGGAILEGTGTITGCSVAFRTAYASTPFCTATGSSTASPVGIVSSPGGFVLNHLSSAATILINYICVGGNLG